MAPPTINPQVLPDEEKAAIVAQFRARAEQTIGREAVDEIIVSIRACALYCVYCFHLQRMHLECDMTMDAECRRITLRALVDTGAFSSEQARVARKTAEAIRAGYGTWTNTPYVETWFIKLWTHRLNRDDVRRHYASFDYGLTGGMLKLDRGDSSQPLWVVHMAEEDNDNAAGRVCGLASDEGAGVSSGDEHRDVGQAGCEAAEDRDV